MPEQRIYGRAVQKHDVESNWSTATSFIPMQGEIIIYDKDSNYDYERIKIGDGSTLVSALPFVDDTVRTSILAEITAIDEKVDTVSGLVGDKSVSTQISDAIANKSDSNHTHDDMYYTESEIDSKLSTKSNTGHTHSAYVNQNAFSNVVVGSTTIEADSVTDTLTLVAGNNITLTPDATNDKITISANDGSYTHPDSGVTAGTYQSVTVDEQGHVTGGSNPTTLSGYGITDAVTKTELNAVSDLVGDTAVSAQISDAFDDAIIGLSVSGQTITYTKGSGTTGTIETQDTTTVYTHPSYTAKQSGLYKVAVDEMGHISGATAVTKDDITALGIPSQDTDTTYSAATINTAGLMSAADKIKLNGIATGANKITVDSALSSTSTNPVQNNVVNAALYNLSTLIGDEAVSEQISSAVDAIVHPVQSVNGKTGVVQLTAADVGAMSADTVIPSTDDFATKTYVAESIANKVDKVTGKDLSTNDFTDAEKTKLSGIETGANKTTVDSALSTTSTNPVQNKVVNTAISNLSKLVGDTKVSEQISSAVNSISYPVQSVNGKTGVVQLTASDVGALSADTVIPSTDTFATIAYVDGEVANKVDKITGKGLSTNDFTTTEKNKLANIESGANKTVVDSALSSTSTNPVQNNVVNTAISNLNTLVGDTKVSEQISTAISESMPTSHASSSTTYGVATASLYGHAMASSTTPKANGTAAVGSETAKFARGDHVHPLQTTVSGNAGTATTLATTRYIDGISFNGGANVTRYATCGTTAATVAKTASVTAGTFSLATGARVTVKFTYANTAASPTLNVGSTGAKAIYWHGAKLTTDQYWQAGSVLDFVYNGAQWELVGIAKANTTTYSEATTSTSGLMSASDKSTLDNLSTLVGDTKVSDQINSAVANLNVLTIDTTDADAGTAPYTNADSLGGIAASNYMTKPYFCSFSITEDDWVLDGSVYKYTLSKSVVTASMALFKLSLDADSYRYLNGALLWETLSGAIVFSTDVIPSGALTGCCIVGNVVEI